MYPRRKDVKELNAWLGTIMANMPSEYEYGEFTQLRFIRFPPSVMDDFVVQYSAHGTNIPAPAGVRGISIIELRQAILRLLRWRDIPKGSMPWNPLNPHSPLYIND